MKLRSLVVLILVAVLMTGPVIGSTTAAAGNVSCPALGAVRSVPMPARGFAVVSEGTVTADCRLVFAPDRVVPISQMPAAPSGPQYVSGHGRVSAGDPEATVYQRSWDCCNILMNALYTTLVWNAYGSYVYTTNQWNTTVYHTELWPSRGWWLDYQQLWYSNGCQYCWSRTISGKAGFGYQGVFDPTGTVYYNTYLNTMQGNGDGSWYCTWQFWWRNSAPGWKPQNWCANGYNP